MEKKVRDFSKKELADLEKRLERAGFSYSSEYSGGDVFDASGEVDENLYSVAYRKENEGIADPDLSRLADETGKDENGGEVLYFFLYYGDE